MHHAKWNFDPPVIVVQKATTEKTKLRRENNKSDFFFPPLKQLTIPPGTDFSKAIKRKNTASFKRHADQRLIRPIADRPYQLSW